MNTELDAFTRFKTTVTCESGCSYSAVLNTSTLHFPSSLFKHFSRHLQLETPKSALKDVEEGRKMARSHSGSTLDGDVAKARSRSMMANFFRSRARKLFPLCVSADLHPKNFPVSFFSLSLPALCHHDFFSNHVLPPKSESSPLNSIRFAKLQLFVNI